MADRSDDFDARLAELGPMGKRATAATFAPNWKTVLAVDALMGVLVVVFGLVLSRWYWVGWVFVPVGLIYVFLVLRRFLQWRWLREQMGV